jgi:uncharacterized membrane protein YccF (DUF307 family)
LTVTGLPVAVIELSVAVTVAVPVGVEVGTVQVVGGIVPPASA